MTVRRLHDAHDGDLASVRSAVETDPWLDEAERVAALAIVDRIKAWRVRSDS